MNRLHHLPDLHLVAFGCIICPRLKSGANDATKCNDFTKRGIFTKKRLICQTNEN